ncbi:MAG: glycosyltransferase [Clostridia bacterium]|nr:glycosyltransferase [Clostridia bacterium]
MKIAEINVVVNGSTGKIMLQIAQRVRNGGDEVRTYSPIRFLRHTHLDFPEIPDHFYWGNRLEACFHFYAGTILGRNGMYSTGGTRQLIKELKKFNPDIIHLHNLHTFCINFPMLFRYIKQNNVKVVWTLHDCWTFTGHCPHFSMINCDKWKTGCHHCPQPKIYPRMCIDTSRKMYHLKKKWFCGVQDLTIVTPSLWLSQMVQQSFLRKYPVRVIHNGIDLSVFKPTAGDFRKKYGLENKKIVLGVSSDWGKRKGLDVFLELSKVLDENYQIVLVGMGKQTGSGLPTNITTIPRTSNQAELAELYTAADVFLNPTREDTFPTVNMEALACGTPVLTFCTGGSPEILDETCGVAVAVNDFDAIKREVCRICEERPFSQQACVERASAFNMSDRFQEYVDLYKERLSN